MSSKKLLVPLYPDVRVVFIHTNVRSGLSVPQHTGRHISHTISSELNKCNKAVEVIAVYYNEEGLIPFLVACYVSRNG